MLQFAVLTVARSSVGTAKQRLTDANNTWKVWNHFFVIMLLHTCYMHFLPALIYYLIFVHIFHNDIIEYMVYSICMVGM